MVSRIALSRCHEPNQPFHRVFRATIDLPQVPLWLRYAAFAVASLWCPAFSADTHFPLDAIPVALKDSRVDHALRRFHDGGLRPR